MSDRYLKIVLTAIVLELAWLGVSLGTRPASAQGPLPVVITGVQLQNAHDVLTVAVTGVVPITANAPLKIEADRPLLVESVRYTPGLTPGSFRRP